MGGSCNCVTDSCNKGTFLFTNEINPLTNRPEESEKLKSLNHSFMEDPQYQKQSKEFFDIFNDIRINPNKYLTDSKDYSLLEIFIKLKPSNEINYSETNIKKIKKYLINSHFLSKRTSDQEKEIIPLINDGKVKEISLFQTICTSQDMKENVWAFLQENEDDFEKIFSTNYNYLIIICFPLDYNTKTLTTLIFYQE